MVKTLQRKFILASMASVTILLVFLIGAINLLNWFSVTDRQTRMLEILCETDARPGRPVNNAALEAGRGEDIKAGERGADRLLVQDGRDREGLQGLFRRRFSMDDALSTRYFAVWFDAQGEVLRTDVSQIYAVTAEEAEAFGKEVYADEDKTGVRDSFRYLLREAGTCGPEPETQEEGRILVAMDISGDRRDLLSVLGISAVIALVCWIAMLVPVHALARLAIAPTALSIERQKQFVTNAGHELKTPLAIIQANTDALELYNGASKWTRNIRSQTVRLSGLMQNLLTLSKMDESSLQLERRPLDLRALAEEVWENFAEPAAGRGLTFGLEAEEGADLRALADRDSLAQLFSILYDNAVKYTPRGGGIRLHISRDPHGKLIRIEQSNPVAEGERDGKGGIPADPDRLFERFYRTDTDRSRKKGGYGIGLSAARAIAGANHGSIHADVREGNICFTVCLEAA